MKIVRGTAGTLGILFFLATLVMGCGSSHPAPGPMSLRGSMPQPMTETYRLRVGDEVSILVIDHTPLSGTVKVAPDGMLTAPGVSTALPAAGHSLAELTEELRGALKRIVRFPEVSVMLTSYVAQQIYVFGEVQSPGAKTYVPQMTTLHALGQAGGGTTIAKLAHVMVLRRSGPTSLEVYQLDLSDALHGKAQARDLFLEPYDVVFIPRTVVGEINQFLRQWVGNNLIPFTAYIEGWRAFHVQDWKTYDLGE